MKIDIHTHLAGTTPGAVTERGVVGGTFWPDGDGTLETTLEFDPTAKPSYDPDTGEPLTKEIASWSHPSGSAGVSVVNRSRAGARSVLAVWLSSTDIDGTAHTVEVPADGHHEFGFVSVDIRD